MTVFPYICTATDTKQQAKGFELKHKKRLKKKKREQERERERSAKTGKKSKKSEYHAQ